MILMLFKRLFGGGGKNKGPNEPIAQLSEQDDLIDPRTLGVARRGGVDIRRSMSEIQPSRRAHDRLEERVEAENEAINRLSSGDRAGPRHRNSRSEPGGKYTRQTDFWDSTDPAMLKGQRISQEKRVADTRATLAANDDAPKCRSDLGAMQELPKRPGAASSIQVYRSMIVRNGTSVMVRLLLKYASSPTTIMDFNREIQLHKQLQDAMFVHKRHGSFDTEHSIYLVLDDVMGCLSYGSLKAILEGRLNMSRDDTEKRSSSSKSSQQHVPRASLGVPSLNNRSSSAQSAGVNRGEGKMSIGSGVQGPLGSNLPSTSTERRFASGVVVPLLVALAELQVKGIIHRDVRPENIYFTRGGQVVLGGFANAVERKVERAVSQVGRVDFMAPEMLTKPTLTQLFHRVVDEGISEDELPSYDNKVDVWSLAVCFLYLLTGCNPFAPTVEELGHKDILYSQAIESKHMSDVQGQWASRVLRQQLKISEDLSPARPAPSVSPEPPSAARVAELWSQDASKNAAVTTLQYVFGDVMSLRAFNRHHTASDAFARPPGFLESSDGNGGTDASALSSSHPTEPINPGAVGEMSPGFVDLLSRMFVFDPARRASAVELLQHPYVKDVAQNLCKQDVRSRLQTLCEQAPQAESHLESLTADSFARDRRTSQSKLRRSSVENRYRQYQRA